MVACCICATIVLFLQKQAFSAERRPKISVGTQNELGSKHSSNKPTGVPRSVTRTIILVDTAAQTGWLASTTVCLSAKRVP